MKEGAGGDEHLGEKDRSDLKLRPRVTATPQSCGRALQAGYPPGRELRSVHSLPACSAGKKPAVREKDCGKSKGGELMIGGKKG